MGWFDEQIKLRKQRDDEGLRDAFSGIAAAIIRGRSGYAGSDARMQAKNAIDEILNFYRIKTQDIPDHVVELNDQLEYLLRPAGVMRRKVTLEEGWYKDGIGPVLAFRKEDGAPVALLPNAFSGYTYPDETTGKRAKIDKKTAALFEEDAICFYKPLPATKLNLLALLNYIRQVIPMKVVAFILLVTLAAVLVGMNVPYISQMLFGPVLDSGSNRALLGLAIYAISVSITTVMVSVIKNMLLNRVNTQLDIHVQAAMMARLFSLPADFFKNYSSGELASSMNYANTLCSMIVSSLFSAGFTSLFSLLYIFQIFSYAPSLALPALLVVLLSLALTLTTSFLQMKRSRKQMELAGKNSGMTYSMISGIQKLRLAGAEKRAFTRWLRHYTAEAQLVYRPPLLITLNSVLSVLISTAGTLLIYAVALANQVSVSEYYAFTSAYGSVSGAFSALAGMAVTIAQIRSILDYMKPILQAEPEISENKAMVSRLSGGIELENLCFRYNEDMPLVVDHLSLKIRPGQYVAIVGKTGCGKSTLVRLMLGFETPQRGAVYYDGKNLKNLDLKSLRSNIGAVIQNGKLFSGDIFSNIAISAPDLTLDGAWEAAEMAGIADDIRAMPMGMHTIISEGSGGISGGQRQRLMIARAIAPKPKILIFDEATSALDNLTQKKISEALDSLRCTRIVIAHRLSTIRQCDRILVLDRGRIIEDGTYDELIAQNGFFAELVNRQRLDSDQ